MKRIAIAISIIIIMISYSFFSINIVKKHNNELLVILDNLLESYENKDMSTALNYAYEFETAFSNYEKEMSFIVRDERLHTLNLTVSKMIPYLEDANDELEAEIENIKSQLSFIYRSEIPYWQNIV